MKKYCLFIFSLIFLFNCELEEPVKEEPSIKIISPNDNSYVYETVNIVAEAEDNKGIVYVEFYIDGETNSNMKDLIPPYSYDWNVINLPDSSVHTIYAKAVDTDDNMSSSKMVTITVNNQLGVPEPVQLDASISSIDSSVVLQWSSSTIEDFSYYSIYRDTISGININSDHLLTINEDTVIKYTDANVLDNMTYFYAVYLVDKFGFRSKSNEVEISVPNKNPESVLLYSPTNVTDSTMLIIWKKSQAHDFQKYSLFRSLSSNPDQTSNIVFETTNINQNSYSDSGLEKGVIYYYRLAIYDTGDLFSLSNVVYDTAETKITPMPVDGLVAYYPFIENANDESGNGNNGTLYGATLTTDRFGDDNSAFYYDGIDDYIDCGNNEILNVAGPGDQWSISLWFEYTGNTYAPLIGKFDENSDGWGTYINDNGQIQGRLNVGGSPTHSFNHITKESIDSNWHLLNIIWYSGANQPEDAIQIYLDGNISECDIISPYGPNVDYNNDAPFLIGKQPSNAKYFVGKIDDVRIYNRVLDETEIQILYHENGW